MKVKLKLFATLSDFLPQPRHGNEVDLEVADTTTVAELIAAYNLPQKLVHLVLLDGTFIPENQRAGTRLYEGAVLAIWPPIAGG